MAQGSQERRCLPSTLWNLGKQPLAVRRPAMGARHVGLGPGLIDEDQARWIDPALMLAPLRSATAYVRAVPLARDQRLFLNVIPSRRKKRLSIEVSAFTERSAASRRLSAVSVMSGCSLRAASRKSRCGLRTDGR